MTVPSIRLYSGIVPNPNTQPAEEFSNNAIDWTSYQADELAADINDSVEQFNIDFITVNSNTIAAADSAISAAESELASSESALTSEANANFKGLWADLTGSLNIPATVSHNGKSWQLLNDLADVTASEPSVTSDWQPVNDVDLSQIRYSKLDNPLTHLFKKNKLVDTLSGALTWTRATTATYIDRYGVLQTAAIDEPRQEKDGWLIEGASTNLLTQSNDFEHADWSGSTGITYVSTTELAPDGSNTATRIQGTSGAEQRRTEDFALSGDETISFWVKSPGAGQDKFRLQISSRNSHVATDEWVRYSFSRTAIGSNTNYGIGADGEAFDIIIWQSQVENLNFASSNIPTTTASATRAGDDVSCPVYNNFPDVTSNWSLFVNIIAPYPKADYRLFQISSGNSQILVNSIGNLIYQDSAASTSLSTTVPDGESYTLVITYDGIDMKTYLNGSISSTKAISTATFDPSEIMSVFSDASLKQIQGTSSTFKIYDFTLNAAEVSFLNGE